MRGEDLLILNSDKNQVRALKVSLSKDCRILPPVFLLSRPQLMQKIKLFAHPQQVRETQRSVYTCYRLYPAH